jgi:LacI family transcriptional regulator
MTKNKIRSITIRDVAQQAGVSVATVSRYINQNAPISTEAAARLQAVMEKLNYVPHASARKLATHKTQTIGLVLSDISGDFFAPLLNGIEAITSQNGFDLLISSTRQLQRRKGQLPIGPHNVDGLLIFADSLDTQDLELFYTKRFPMVMIHQTPPQTLSIPCVTVENKAASCKLVSHLIEAHGKRRIVFVGGPVEQEDSLWRETGYREALAAHDLTFDPGLVISGDFDRRVAKDAVRKLVESGVPFDAIFSADDESAVGVITALQDAGRKVPEEIAVVGFDDQIMSPYLTPPLTTVRAPTEEVGRQATMHLIKLIQGQDVAPLTLLPTEIVIRRSCGCG